MIVEAPCARYTMRPAPNLQEVSHHIDNILAAHFNGRKVVLRAVSSGEHNMSKDEFLKQIERLGTDRYDAGKTGDRYDNAEGKHIDFFGRSCVIAKGKSLSLPLLEGFHIYGPKFHDKPPVRMDTWLVYDRSAVRAVTHSYVATGQAKRDGFVFRGPAHKPEALLGIVSI